MHVYIKHRDDSDVCPGGAETWTSPATASMDHWRLYVSKHDALHWGLALSHWEADKWAVRDWLLLAATYDLQDYKVWLSDNIEYIEVDSHPWYEAPIDIEVGEDA